MVDYVAENDGGVIALDTGSSGTGDTIKKSKASGVNLFLYNPEDHLDDEDAGYVF